jgi:hypothetical protein
MTAIQMLTSLSPRIRRTLLGTDVGVDLQRNCVNSVSNAFGNCTSLNFIEEREALTGLYPDLDFAFLGSMEKSPFPYPLMAIRKLQTFAERHSHFTHVGIINADIYVQRTRPQVMSRIIDEPDAVFIFTRQESINLGHSSHVPYIHGFDLMILPRAYFLTLALNGLALGVPWWDYAVPLIALFQGRKVYASTGADLRHMTHPQAWNLQLWNAGLKALFAAMNQNCGRDHPLRSWSDILGDYLNKPLRGHDHDSMLYNGGTLFARQCHKTIFNSVKVI